MRSVLAWRAARAEAGSGAEAQTGYFRVLTVGDKNHIIAQAAFDSNRFDLEFSDDFVTASGTVTLGTLTLAGTFNMNDWYVSVSVSVSACMLAWIRTILIMNTIMNVHIAGGLPHRPFLRVLRSHLGLLRA